MQAINYTATHNKAHNNQRKIQVKSLTTKRKNKSYSYIINYNMTTNKTANTSICSMSALSTRFHRALPFSSMPLYPSPELTLTASPASN